MKSELIENLILNGKYEDAKNIINNMDFEQVQSDLLELAYEKESLCIYSFVRYMFENNHDLHWLALACTMIIGPFCFIEGAYSIGLFHARQLLKFEYSIQNLEMLLFFYDIPEKLLKKEEAVCIAQEIIKIDNKNKLAKKILEEK